MNAPDRITPLPDIQSKRDDRELRIDAAGISGVRYPMRIRTGNGIVPTVALLALTVGLPAGRKGTPMSRFIELLEARTEALDQTFARIVRAGPAAGSTQSGRRQDRNLRLLSLEAAT